MAMYTRTEQGNLVPFNFPSLKGDRGEQGLPGKNGQDGITPDIQIGTVTTLEPDQQATVTKRGTKENPILDFAVPRGIDGNSGTIENNTLVTTEIVDNVLTLTTDKYQTTRMINGTTIVLPNVDTFTEIHLFFDAIDDLTLVMPGVGWQTEPNIVSGKTYEFIFTYTNKWLGGSVEYYLLPEEPVMNGLVCWLEAKDLQVNSNNMIINDTVWKNKVLGKDNAIIKTITGNEVQSNDVGYFRTNKNAYVVLPSFEANSTDGLSIYVDAKINQKPTEQYSRMFTLGHDINYEKQLSMGCGLSEFGYIRNFVENNTRNLIGNINSNYPMLLRLGVQVGNTIASNNRIAKNYENNESTNLTQSQTYNHTFSNNFLCAESPTILNKADISYKLVLIYNRALTEKEMLHNYRYSLSL